MQGRDQRVGVPLGPSGRNGERTSDQQPGERAAAGERGHVGVGDVAGEVSPLIDGGTRLGEVSGFGMGPGSFDQPGESRLDSRAAARPRQVSAVGVLLGVEVERGELAGPLRKLRAHRQCHRPGPRRHRVGSQPGDRPARDTAPLPDQPVARGHGTHTRRQQRRATDLGVQAVQIRRETLGALIAELAAMPVAERRAVDGIKPARGDVILAAAITIDTVLETAGLEAIEATEFGLREGIFLERHLADLHAADGLAAYPDVRAAAVENLAARYDDDPPHRRHVTRLALEIHDQLGACGTHAADRDERSLLDAAARLHDIGVAVNHDDHHKHGRYLVVTNGLPGFSPAETALIGQAIRYHRKGTPTMKPFRALTRDGDDRRLLRLAAALRLAEGLDRGHDQAVRGVELTRDGDDVRLRLLTGAGGDPVARWAAQGQAALVERAFGVRLTVADGAS